MTVRPGSVHNLTLTVLTSRPEPEEEDLYFRFYVLDFEVGEDGKIAYAEAGSLKRSASSWIELEAREFKMAPAGKKAIGLKLTVPRDASGGYYSAIVLEKLPIAALAKRQKVVHTVRMVSLVELTVEGRGGLRTDVVITGVDVGRVGGQEGTGFTVTVENRGSVHIKGKGELLVRTKHGGTIAAFPLEAGRGMILPESGRSFEAVLDRQLSAGDYIAEAVVEYGLRGKAVARVPFSISGGHLSATGALDAEKGVKFLVDPYWVDMTASPGAFRAVPILVENDEEVSIHVSAVTRDVAFDIEGRLTVSDPSGSEWSCADWVEFKPGEFDLKPRERRQVLANVSIPKDVTGGRSTQVDFVASLLDSGSGGPVESSAGTTLLVTVPGELNAVGRIVSVKVSQNKETGAIDFLASFKNEGNVHVVPKGKVVITSLTGGIREAGGEAKRLVGEIEFDEIMGAVLQGGTRRFRAQHPGGLDEGEYSAEVVLSYGGENPATAVREFIVY